MKINKGALILLGLIYCCSVSAQAVKTLKLAHDKPRSYPTSKALAEIAREVKSSSQGRLEIKIYPSSQLVNQADIFSLLEEGDVVQMSLVNSRELAAEIKEFMVYNIPYLVKEEKDITKILNNEISQNLLSSMQNRGYTGLNYYPAGMRSFYTNAPIEAMDDFKKLKIAVSNEPIEREMIELLGADPILLNYSDYLDAFRNNEIDGAFCNFASLALENHNKYAPYYLNDRHAMSLDILIVSNKAWSELSEEERQLLNQAFTRAEKLAAQKWDAFNKKQENQPLDIKIGGLDADTMEQTLQPLFQKIEVEYPVVYENYMKLRDSIEIEE